LRAMRQLFRNRQRSLDGVVYVVLTVLVWGTGTLRRGLWQDDVQALSEAFQRLSRSFHALFGPDPAPLRRLTLVPSALAWVLPHPIWALQFLSVAIWLALALAAGWLLDILLPGRPWTRFAVVCLTLTATSDLTTASIVPLAYNTAALLILLAAIAGFRWIGGGGSMAFVASPILLVWSALTMDVALPAIPFLILLFIWIAIRTEASNVGQSSGLVEESSAPRSKVLRSDPRARLLALLATWIALLVPISITEWAFLRDPKGYAAIAILPMSRGALVGRTFFLWLTNFAPWNWAFWRPLWSARPPASVIPVWIMAATSLAALSIVLMRLRGRKDDETAMSSCSLLLLVALFISMALVANAAYARVWFSAICYRTHILSRIWSSLALGILAGWLRAREGSSRWFAWIVVSVFVFLGTWGGVERQDFYLSSWLGHQRELASVLNAAPAIRPGTCVILRVKTSDGRFLTTGADYLALHWLRLLYEQPRLRSARIEPRGGSDCRVSGNGVECWGAGQRDCVIARTCDSIRARYQEMLLFDYDNKDGTYHLVQTLQHDALAAGNESAAGRYDVRARIIAAPWTPLQKRLLLRD
jgi:hypothetical protein